MPDYNFSGIPKAGALDNDIEEPSYSFEGIPVQDNEFNFEGIPTEDNDVYSDPSFFQKAGKLATESGKGFLRGVEGGLAGIGAVTKWIGDSLQKERPIEKNVPPEYVQEVEKYPEVVLRKAVGAKISEWGDTAHKFWKKEAQRGIEAPDEELFKGSFMENPSFTRASALIAQAVPSLATATAITFVTKSPIAGAGSLGLLEGSEQYIEAREAGKDVDFASLLGGLSTAGNTLLEIIPLTRFLKGGEGKLVKDAFIGAGQEGTEEALQSLWTNTIAKLGYDETRKLTEGMVEGLIAGAGSGGLVGAYSSGRGIQTQTLIDEAKSKGVSQDTIDTMQEAVANQIISNSEQIDKELDNNAKTITNKINKVNEKETKTTTPHIEKISEKEHENLTFTLGRYLSNNRGSVDLPTKAIDENINKFKDALGKEFVRFHGLTPEARASFTRLMESRELKQDDIIEFVTKEIDLSDEDASYLTSHIENPTKYPIAPNLKPQADAINAVYENIFQELSKRKLLNAKFPDTFIQKAFNDIAKEQEALHYLTQKRKMSKKVKGTPLEKAHIKKNTKAIARREDRIAELKEKIDYLETLRYVPHKYQGLVESQVTNLFSQGRLGNKLNASVKKIKGRRITTLDEAKSLGLIPVEDIRILTGAYMDYTLNKIAIHDFIEDLKSNPEIVQTEKEAPKEWESVLLSQLNGYKVHPYLANALENYSFQPQKRGAVVKAYDDINRLAKTLLFYNPFIMSVNDASQAYGAGAVLNKKFVKNAWESVHDFTEKTDFYKDAISAGLFSTPYNTRPSIEHQIELALEQQNKEFPFIKKVTKYANPLNIYDEVQKATWSLDRIWRLTTLKHFLQQGLEFQQAVDRTKLFLVDYNFIPDRLRQGLNRVFLTPTYRSQMMRLYFNLIRHPIKYKGAIGRLVGFHIAVALALARAGYKRENLYRFVKKLDEPIRKEDGTVLSEQVVVGAGPLFEYNKIFGRAFSKSLYLNLARVPYILTSIHKNKDWKSEPVYDPILPIEHKSVQIINYIIRNYVAPIEGFSRLSDEEQSAIEKTLNLLAIPVYKRQDSVHYQIGQVHRITGELRDFMRRHPNATKEQKQMVINEAQKRMDKVIKQMNRFKEEK